MKENIIKSYEKASLDYYANSNSLHELGLKSRKLEEAASKQILDVLNLNDYDVIYTSGNAESYTLILNNLRNCFINTVSDELKNVSLEMNIDINSKIGKRYNHIDISGKYNLFDIDNLCNYDFITLEDEIPFLGVLVKKKNIDVEPLVHGGKSTTKYRSGTSSTPLIVAMSKLIKEKYRK